MIRIKIDHDYLKLMVIDRFDNFINLIYEQSVLINAFIRTMRKSIRKNSKLELNWNYSF